MHCVFVVEYKKRTNFFFGSFKDGGWMTWFGLIVSMAALSAASTQAAFYPVPGRFCLGVSALISLSFVGLFFPFTFPCLRVARRRNLQVLGHRSKCLQCVVVRSTTFRIYLIPRNTVLIHFITTGKRGLGGGPFTTKVACNRHSFTSALKYFGIYKIS